MKPEEIFAHWKHVRAGLFLTMDQFQDDELHYKPYDDAWSVRETLLHIANAEHGWFRFGVTGELDEWPGKYSLDDYLRFEDIKKLLTEVHDWTEKFIADLTIDDYQKVIEVPWGEKIPLGWILWHVLEHEVHHRGELSLILGLLGRAGLDV
jgi:uncharacterized damage-inducible protein DinB